MKTEQEIFNKVWTHFFIKNNPRAIVENRCKYRTYNGNKCAVGCLIPYKLYDPKIEGKACDVNSPDNSLIEILKKLYIYKYIDLLSELQSAHDQLGEKNKNKAKAAFKQRMIDIAKERNLTIPN
jgi:hypothetical protein